jgi:hypothetical protein
MWGGEEHPSTLASVNDLALIFEQQGKYTLGQRGLSWLQIRQILAEQIPSSVLLICWSDGNTSYMDRPKARDIIDGYLVNLTLPAANTSVSDVENKFRWWPPSGQIQIE